MTYEIAKQYFTYNSLTGEITRIKPSISKNGRSYIRKDTRADRSAAHGYRNVSLTHNGVFMRIRAHRLAWLLHYGSFPLFEIDHINGKTGDNRICNLRDCDHSSNLLNRHAKWGADKTLPIGVTRKTRIRKDRGGRSFTNYYITLCKNGIKRWAIRKDRDKAIALRKEWEMQCA